MKIKFLLIIVSFLLLLSGCMEEIDLTSEKYKQALVINGAITNKPGPYTVKISYSSRISYPQYKPVAGCTVTIEEKSGTVEQLMEVDTGMYKTSEGGIQGKVGHSYRVVVETPDGKTFQSDYQKIREPVGIDSIYHRFEHRTNPNTESDFEGYQFYISTETAQEKETYFLWQLKETYEYTADWPLVATMHYGVMKENIDTDSIYRCWKTNYVKEIFNENTLGLAIQQIKNHPLNYVTTESKRLQHKYSLLIKQFIINQDAYTYWNNIREQLSGEDFLYARQPFPIRGNMYNPSDEKQTVLGYFTVAGVTSRRVFVDSPHVELNIDKCFVDHDLRFINPLSFHAKLYFTRDNNGLGMVQESCIDCRMEGGSLEKPNFWID